MNAKGRQLSTLGACLLMLALSPATQAQTRVEVIEVEGVVERATGPAALMKIDGDGKLTVRALRGFGVLPESHAKLVLDARGQGVDLLTAGPQEVQALLERVEAGTLKLDPQALQALLELFETRGFYTWQALQAGESLELGKTDFIRGDGRAVVRDPAGPVLTLAPAGRSGTTQQIAASAAVEGVQAAQPAAVTTPAVASAVVQTTAPAQTTEAPGSAPEGAIARIWSDAPGMRLFDRSTPDQNSDMSPHLPGSVAALPDGGYVVAGSVQAAAGQSVWVAAHGPDGMLRWSRSFGSGFDLYAQAVAASADGGALVVGSLGDERPGFLLALDASGALRWSRVSDPDWATRQVVDTLTGVAVNAQGVALAVGQARDAQSNRVALALAVPADGSPGWRLELTEGVVINAVMGQGDGWWVAGETPATQSAWIGRIDASGKLEWQRTYGEDKGGAVRTMAALADGRVAIAGQTEGEGRLWLRILEQDGTLASGGEHAPEVLAKVPGGGKLLGMVPASAGGVWLSGVTASKDGWLARLDAGYVPLWAKVYGGEADDALNALLARPKGAVAVGVSQSGEREGARSLWVVSVDDDGLPVTAPALSESAARLRDSLDTWGEADTGLVLGGETQLSEAPDGAIRIVWPFARLQEGLPLVAEAAEVEVGELRVEARPADKDGRWRVVVDLPATMAVRDTQGNEVGQLNLPSRKFNFDWLQPAGQAVSADILFDDVSVRLDGQPRLEALYAALGLPTGEALFEGDEVEAGQVTIKQIQAGLNLKPGSNKRWAGPLRFTLTDAQRKTLAGDMIGRLGGIRLSADYADVDLVALGQATETMTMMMAGEGDSPAEVTPQSLVQDFLNASGSVKGELALSDIEIGATDATDAFRLGELSASGFFAPSKGAALQRDLGASYKVKGLGFRGEGNELAMASLDYDFSVDRLALATIVDVAAGFFMGASSSQASLPEMLNQLLGGIEMKFSTTGLRVTAQGEAPASLDSMSMRLGLSGLDTPSATVDLTYAHEGFSGVPDVPPEVMPNAAGLDLGLTGLPLGALLAGAFESEADPMQAIMTLAANAARFNIRKLSLDMPIGGLQISGIALAEAPTSPDSFPLARLTADIEVRNLDAIVNWMAGTVPEAERKDMLAGAAMIKLAGIEEKRAEGAVVHRFAVVASSEGELTVNGKDLAPLFAAE